MCDCSISYSLPELAPEEHYRQLTELPAGEAGARMAIYELLGRLLAVPDEESHAGALFRDCAASLAREGARLSFPALFGNPPPRPATAFDEFRKEYLRLFGGYGSDGAIAPLSASAWLDEAAADRHREEVADAFDYYGMPMSPEDPRPVDHLATALEFVRHLAFSEAAACSPRLQQTFRTAQRDFLDRSLAPWLPLLRDCVYAHDSLGFWAWTVDNIVMFTAADLACLEAPARCGAAPPAAGVIG